MKKMELGKNITRTDGLIQATFALRDIHFQPDALVVYTLEGNIVVLPAEDFAAFTDAINAAVKNALVNPPVLEAVAEEK